MLYQFVRYLLYQQLITYCLYNCGDTSNSTAVLSSSSSSSSEWILQSWFLRTFGEVTLPYCWVCNNILYRLLFFTLSRSLLHRLDQLICFYFLCFDISLIASAVAAISPFRLYPCTTPTLMGWPFSVCLFFRLHISILHFYSLLLFISVLLSSLTGTTSICAAHFSWQVNRVVCFFWSGGLGVSKIVVFGCLPTYQCLCHTWSFIHIFILW